MQRKFHWGCMLLIGLCAAGPVAGCRSSTHREVYIYEYNNDRNTEPQADPRREGAWKMVAPDEMVVDPPRGG